ncbi:hypothetical protein [Pacificispira sp.]|uniref:hypothetical protein n=1 Tax=Pacificispira sp. TaxID=2888761 RepID=UPI003BABF0EC
MSHLADEAYLKESFRALTHPEQLALWAIRMWVRAYRTEDREAAEAIRHGLILSDVPDGTDAALDRFMTVLAVSTQVSIDIRCPNCKSVSPDEHRLMGALAAMQQTGRHDPAILPMAPDRYLSVWLPPAAIRLSRAPLQALAHAFDEAELRLRPRSWVLQSAAVGEAIEGRSATVHTIH